MSHHVTHMMIHLRKHDLSVRTSGKLGDLWGLLILNKSLIWDLTFDISMGVNRLGGK